MRSVLLIHCILGNFSCFFLSSAVCFFYCFFFFFKINFLKKIISGIPLECQTVWTLNMPDDSSGLIWVRRVCQGYHDTGRQRVNQFARG